MSGSVAEDGSAVVLTFDNTDGTSLTTALNKEQLSKAITFMLGLAIETGERFAPEFQETEEVTAVPLPVAQIGVAKGRTDTEAILGLQCGILQLAFATELGTLLEVCKNLQSIAVAAPAKKPQ